MKNRGFHQIRRLSVVGGFLDGLEVTFEKGLVCIIGPRGTGKSTVLELIRYALEAMPGREGDRLRRRAESLIENNLKGGRVELSLETMNGLSYTITRTSGEPAIVVDQDGKPANIRGAELFRADLYSQNEIESIAENPSYQLDLLDKFQQHELAGLHRELQETWHELEFNKGLLLPLLSRREQLEVQVQGLGNVEEKLKTMEEVDNSQAGKINEVHADKALRDREGKALRLILEAIHSRCKETAAIEGRLAQDIVETVDEKMLTGQNQGKLRSVLATLTTLAQEADRFLEQARSMFQQAAVELEKSQSEIKLLHDAQELQFRELIEKYEADQQLSMDRSKYERERNDLLFKRRELEEVNKQIETAYREREKLIDRLGEWRDRRFGIRRDVADVLNQKLMPDIRVNVAQCADCRKYVEYLTTNLKGSGIKLLLLLIKNISATLSPGELAELLRAGDANNLSNKGKITESQATAMIRAFDPGKIFDLELIDTDDTPTIELHDEGGYKESAKLSTGQKCTAILPILLFDSANPLLIDQPEDNLDNSYVYTTTVQSLRKVKQKRQLIFVTHNPNIPVLGDANQVIVMKSNGQTARPARTGNVDDCREEIVTLLEGGETAFKARKDRYAY